MAIRDELDLAEVVKVVVAPALELFLPGDLDSVRLGWDLVDLVDGTDRTRLMLSLQVKGRSCLFQLADPDQGPNGLDLAWLADEIYELVRDFIAESGFGWDALRERPR